MTIFVKAIEDKKPKRFENKCISLIIRMWILLLHFYAISGSFTRLVFNVLSTRHSNCFYPFYCLEMVLSDRHHEDVTSLNVT